MVALIIAPAVYPTPMPVVRIPLETPRRLPGEKQAVVLIAGAGISALEKPNRNEVTIRLEKSHEN